MFERCSADYRTLGPIRTKRPSDTILNGQISRDIQADSFPRRKVLNVGYRLPSLHLSMKMSREFPSPNGVADLNRLRCELSVCGRLDRKSTRLNSSHLG